MPYTDPQTSEKLFEQETFTSTPNLLAQRQGELWVLRNVTQLACRLAVSHPDLLHVERHTMPNLNIQTQDIANHSTVEVNGSLHT